MKELQEIEVAITNEGRLSMEVHGVKGDACLELTKALEETLGGEVLERKLTYEYDQPSIRARSREKLLRGDR